MKIAQIVVTQTPDGDWKIAVMSLRQTEKVWQCQYVTDAVDRLDTLLKQMEWETPAL